MTHPTNGRLPNSSSARARAGELAHIALRRVSGMSALLLLLVCVVFVMPAFMSFGREWEVVTDILVHVSPPDVSGTFVVFTLRFVTLPAAAIGPYWNRAPPPVGAALTRPSPNIAGSRSRSG